MSDRTATITPVARARGELTDWQRTWLAEGREELTNAQEEYRGRVLSTLRDGASFAEVSRETGLSTNTLQRWKREAGK